MNLPALYHWSPRNRRLNILREGLKLYSSPIAHSSGAFPYLCFSTTPRTAWGLLGDVGHVSDIEEWDLWQVTLAESDDVVICTNYGPWISEVRVRNSIPADRLWLVATRQPLTMRQVRYRKRKAA